MSENAVVAWDPNSGAALPAYLADAMGGMGTNIQDRTTVPSLSYEGKTWTLVKSGNKAPLQIRNADGDVVPVPIMRMVILNYNPDRGRAYYPGVYNPAESKQPDCWSADGVTPDASAKVKQSTLCNGCPMSVKGSKVQDGKEMVACSSHRMVAIAPADGLADDPYRLKIAVTSDWDKETVEHGWFAFRQYTDFLKSRGITHTALVVTKVKFDPTTAFPKLLFALDRLLTPDEVAQVVPAAKSAKVEELLNERWSAAGTQGTPTNDSDIKPHGLEGAYADGWTAHPESPGYSYKGQECLANADLAARYPAPEPAAPPPVPQAETPAIPASEQIIDQTPTPAPTPAEPPKVPKPTDPAHIAHAGTPNELWWNGADWVTPWEPEVAAAPPPPPAPEPEPTPPPAPVHDARANAEANGWAQHPDSPPHMFKGQEVKTTEEVLAMYPDPNAAAAPAAPVSAAPAAATGEALPEDVQNLLSKWGN